MFKNEFKKETFENVELPKNMKGLIRFTVGPYRLQILLFVVLSTIGVFAWAASPYFISVIVDRLAEKPEVDRTIIILAAAYFLAILVDELGWRAAEFTASRHSVQMIERTRSLMFEKTMGREHDYFVNSQSGRISHWINQVASTADGFRRTTYWTVWGSLVGLISSFVILFFSHNLLALLFLFWMIVLFWYNNYRGAGFTELNQQEADEISKVTGATVDSVANHSAVRVFNQQTREASELHKMQSRAVSIGIKAWNYRLITNAVKGQSVVLINLLAVISILWLFDAGEISVGSIILFIAYFSAASSSLWSLAWAFDTYYEQAGIINNALQGLSGGLERSGRKLSANEIGPEVRLSFKNVKFAYPDQPEKNILKGVDLEIEAGQKVGLVGHSGAGKTTLVGMTLSMYDPTSGSILLNSHDLADLDPTVIRSVSSYVLQDTSLFNRTIKQNVAYGKKQAADTDVIAALKRAEAYSFVKDLPEGINTMIGERGVKLSGGQRQRVAIARALLRDAPLLVLDEATSALDSVSEQAIQKALHRLMKGRTAIVVAHRLSTLKHLDKIVVMDKGRVVEQGSHDELVKSNGIYADLWSRQKDGFLVE